MNAVNSDLKILKENEVLKRIIQNPTEHLKECLPIIEQAFVEFYGKEKSSHIRQKFENMIIFCSRDIDDIIGWIFSYENNSKRINRNLFLSEIEKYDEETESRSNQNTNWVNCLEFFYRFFYEKDFNVKIDLLLALREQGYNNVDNSNLEDLFYNGTFNDLTQYMNTFKKYREKYLNEIKFTQSYRNYFEDIQNLKIELEQKYNVCFNKYLDEESFLGQLSDKEKDRYQQMTKEYYNLASDFRINKQIIDDQNLVAKDGYSYLDIANKTMAVIPNYKHSQDGFLPYPVVCISPGGSFLNCLDENIIHELNHAYELVFKYLDENTIVGMSGWDQVSVSINSTELVGSNVKRPYEILNEAINDYIAQQIIKNMYRKNCYIFGNSTTSNIRSEYQSLNPFIEPFFKEFKDEIIESREEGEINKLAKIVGNENLIEFNALINNYYAFCNHYMLWDNLYEQYKRGEINEDTKKLGEFYMQRDKIITQMQEYKFRVCNSPDYDDNETR